MQVEVEPLLSNSFILLQVFFHSSPMPPSSFKTNTSKYSFMSIACIIVARFLTYLPPYLALTSSTCRIDAKTSSYYAGAVYDVSLVMSPFLGGVIVFIGYRGFLCSACAILTIPVFGILAFTYVPPLVATLWLGVTYSIAGELNF